MRSNVIEAEEIIVNGTLISNIIKSDRVKVIGVLKSHTLNTSSINVSGLVDVKEINAKEIHIYGRINSYKMTSNAIVLNVTGVSRIDILEAEKLVVKSIVQYRVRGRLLARKVYAVEAYSEFLVSDLYVCCKCTIGDSNRISRFIYGEITDVSPTSSFNEKPLGMPDVCKARNRDELLFIIPT